MSKNTKNAEPRQATKQKKPRKKMNFFTKTALIVFVAFCVFSIYNMQTQINTLHKQQAELTDKIDKSKEQVAEMQENLEEPYDDEFIIKAAREKMGYSFPGEDVYYNDLQQ